MLRQNGGIDRRRRNLDACVMTSITRRTLVFFVLGLALFLARAAAEHKQMNVLFIISDDLRTELGCYGSKLAKTPNIDKLSAQGVRFDRAYCQYPLCNPSRASMLTGRHPGTTGVLGNRTDFRALHPDWVTLPQLFKQNGYASLRTGKIFHGGIDDAISWTEGGDARRDLLEGDPAVRRAGRANTNTTSQTRTNDNRPARAQGSDRWIMLEGDGESHGDFKTADRAIRYLRENKDKPFFLAVGFVKPHSPPTAPKKFYDLWDVAKIPLPVDFAPRPTVPEGFPKAAIRPRNSDLFIGRDASEQEAREMTRAYLASSAWMDWNVGRVLAELDQQGLRENTIIVFWGDHGYQLGEKGKWSKAGSLFEQGDRTPFIVVDPRLKTKGQSSERVVQAVDFYPTLAELSGLTPPKEIEGRSLVSLLKTPKAEWNHPAFTVWSEDGKTYHGVVVRTERWRYAEFGPGGASGAMLFDQQADPHELKNLADDPKFAEVRKELSGLVRAYAKGTPSTGSVR
jgi:iduronate 2-sulfatase